ncbi:VOC family protein [Carnobacterium funditum]|uniref:VOC family protein n=1 Tax=Carnobacterium funditum TaxID=2752 RepID=UPI0005547BBC|nr:hypothetical protein [Carnobacterium funditum]
MSLKVKNIFINLSVGNLDKSVVFFTNLGFDFHPLLADQHVSCLILKEGMYVNLIEEDCFKSMTHNDVPNKHTQTEMMLTLVTSSKEKLSDFIDKALILGAIEVEVENEIDGVYGRRFMDLDGHLWELLYYDQATLSFE